MLPEVFLEHTGDTTPPKKDGRNIFAVAMVTRRKQTLVFALPYLCAGSEREENDRTNQLPRGHRRFLRDVKKPEGRDFPKPRGCRPVN